MNMIEESNSNIRCNSSKPEVGDEVRFYSPYCGLRDGLVESHSKYNKDKVFIELFSNRKEIVAEYIQDLEILKKKNTMNTPNILCKEKEDYFVKLRDDTGEIVVCDDAGFTKANTVLLDDGKRRIITTETAKKSVKRVGIKLDPHGKWDAEQCIHTLHKMLKECK